jgi:hypothetical protein
MTAGDDLNELLRRRGGLEGLGREIGQGDPATRQGSVPSIKPRATHRAARWLFGRNAVDVLFVLIASVLLALFVWTLI